MSQALLNVCTYMKAWLCEGLVKEVPIVLRSVCV